MDNYQIIFIDSENYGQQEQLQNIVHEYGETPLQYGALSNSANYAEELLDAGADTNAMFGHYGYAPLDSVAVEVSVDQESMLLPQCAVHFKDPRNDGEMQLFPALDYVEYEEQLITDRLTNADGNVYAEPAIGRRSALHCATINNCFKLVAGLLWSGADLNARDERERTPLHYARPAIAKGLLQAGADPLAQDFYGYTPLHLAVLRKNRNTFRVLLYHTTNLNTRANDGRTPLITAAHLGLENMAITLIKYGADVDASDLRGMTALRWATLNNCHNLLNELLQCEIKLDVQDNDGCTPLHGAKAEATRRLLDAGANTNVQSNDGRTPLHLAVVNRDKSVFHLLLFNTKDLNTRTSHGMTPLMSAVHMGLENMTIDLIAAGADVNAADHKGMTALHMAALHNRFNLVKVLLQNGASLKLKDSLCCTALYYAKASIARCLLNAGADANVQNIDGFTPLHSAVVKRDASVLQVLLRKTKDLNSRTRDGMTPLTTAAYNGMEHMVVDLIKAGADVNAVDHKGMTALHRAALHNRLNLVHILLQNGANANIQDINCFTPLHYAKADIARCLIDAGADANIQNNGGFTPLHVAVVTWDTTLFKILLEHTTHLNTRCALDRMSPLTDAVKNAMENMVSDLIQAGADVSINTIRGMTALHWAANFSNLPNYTDAASRRAKVAKMLLEAGADVNARNFSGDTPLHIAMKTKAWPVFEVLLEHIGVDLHTPQKSGKMLPTMMIESYC